MERVKRFGKKTFLSLTIRNYRLYFIGQAISLSGTWMQTIAQSWLVLKITGSGTALGVVTALQFLPILCIGPWAGIIIDRFSKRKLLFFTQASAALLALLLGSIVAVHAVHLWMVYLFALTLGCINAVDNPTRQTFLYEMVGKDMLRNAVTLNSAEINLARVIGPAIGGVIIAVLGLAACFFINSISFLAVLLVLCLMQKDALHRNPPIPKSKGQIRDGFRYVLATPMLRTILLMMAVIGTFTYEFQVVLPLFAHFTFHGDAQSYALLTAAMGIGSVIGAMGTASRSETKVDALFIAAFLLGITIIVTAFMPSFTSALITMLFVGICSINFTSLANSTLLLESTPEMRGRVMSLWTVTFLGSTPIGGPIIGWIAEQFSPRWGLGVGGFVAMAAAVCGFLLLHRTSSKKRIINSTP